MVLILPERSVSLTSAAPTLRRQRLCWEKEEQLVCREEAATESVPCGGGQPGVPCPVGRTGHPPSTQANRSQIHERTSRHQRLPQPPSVRPGCCRGPGNCDRCWPCPRGQ